MFRYKIDVMAAIKAAGYNTTQIRKANGINEQTLLGENALDKIRHRQMVGIKALDQICTMLHCQPGDIIEWVEIKKAGE